MSFLQDLMGGGQQRQEYQDFADRYDQGHPSEGYDDDEVMSRYQQVAPHLSPQDYQAAAQQSFSRMAPEGGCSSASTCSSKRGSRDITIPRGTKTTPSIRTPGTSPR